MIAVTYIKAIFMLIYLDTALGISYLYKNVAMSLSKKIKSPGYPEKNYERNTNYSWYVIASDETEEISLEITIDIHEARGFPCDDYLQIQEINPSGRKFELYKQCGQSTTYRTARGNRLLITLISNDDILTSKGFQLTLKVSKVGPTTRSTSTLSTTTVPTKTRTSAPTVKTVKTTALKEGTALTTRTTSTQSTTTKTRTTAPTVKTTASLLISEDIELSPSYVLSIKSPGYPKVKYKSNTIYSWNVTAPAETKEIFIDIDMDIIRPSRGLCEDYLKIQEIDPFGGSFTVFNECGKLTMKSNALGNRLLIELVSNYDDLTSKGFELNLRVLNEGITTSTLTTRTISSSILSSTTEMRSSIRRRITTAAINTISTSKSSLTVPITTQKRRYLTTQEHLALDIATEPRLCISMYAGIQKGSASCVWMEVWTGSIVETV